MSKKWIISCLDVLNAKVVNGMKFKQPHDAGAEVEL